MKEVFEIYVKDQFSAAHSLRGYEGDCARVHGHNWIVEVYVRCRKLDDVGIGIDFQDLKMRLRKIIQGLDHFNLNDLSDFEKVNPTSENIARFLYKELNKALNTDAATISRVKISETPEAGATYWEE